MNDSNQQEVDELLTAYLDGELSDTERLRLQHRLADEPELRDRLAELQKAWDLLDDLPETPINQEFTKSTLELVTLGAEQGWDAIDASKRIKTKWIQGPKLIAWVAFLSVIVGIGSGAAFRFSQTRSELQALMPIAYMVGLKATDRIAVIEDIAHLDDLDYALEHPEIFDSKILPPIPVELNERAKWVENLTATQQSMLWANERNWNRLPADEKEKYLQLSNEVNTRQDAERLKNVLALVNNIYDDKNNDLLMLKNSVEVPRSERVKQVFYRKLGEYYFTHLDENDREVLLYWMQTLMSEPDLNLRGVFFNYYGDYRRALLRDIFTDPSMMQHIKQLMTGEFKHPKKDIALSLRAQRILANADTQDRYSNKAALLTDAIEEAWRPLPDFAKVLEAYQTWPEEVRDEFEFKNYEDMRFKVMFETSLRNRPNRERRDSQNR